MSNKKQTKLYERERERGGEGGLVMENSKHTLPNRINSKQCYKTIMIHQWWHDLKKKEDLSKP